MVDAVLHDATPSTDLSALSRNASVISTSSSDSGQSPLALPPPRPVRAFTAPRSQSPHSRTPRPFQPPSYLADELGLPSASTADVPSPNHADSPAASKSRSKSRPRNAGVTVDDFKFGPLLGEGSYSTVKLVTHIRTGNQYAIKVLEKAHLIKKDKMATALAEKNALVKLGAGHPGIVRLFYTFQDEWRLYFVIDLARNGEMQSLISKLGSLCIVCARYYAAQVVDALDYMHSKGVIHRDLKPENLLLDDNYRIKITDFGTGKVLESGMEKAETWVGTAQYVSPELLEAKETSKSSDFWALGCIIYQMIAGRFAFQGLSDYLTWQKIKKLDYTFPEGFDIQAQDLVKRLLIRDPVERLGAGSPDSRNDIRALRSHPFFTGVNWDTLWTDPHPPLEPGLVKRERPPSGNHDQEWDDVGATWDDLVGSERSDDEVGWASDGDAPLYERRQHDTVASSVVAQVPLGEVDRPAPTRRETDMTIRDTTLTVSKEPVPSGLVRISPGSSPTSSSEDGPVALKVENMTLQVPTMSSTDDSRISEQAQRGRNQTTSPVQGNGPANEVDYAVLLRLPDGEKVLFQSTVEARSLRRRASRLLPLSLPVPPSKPKTRQLILTTRRLLCLKHVAKASGEVSIKSELALRASEKLKEKEKEKESRGIVASVERKSDREFVVLTSSKTYSYATAHSKLVATWIEKLNAALLSNGRQPSKGPT